MEIFSLKPSIHMYDTFETFAKDYDIGEGDLILTESFLYENFMKPLDLSAHVVLKDQYDRAEPKEVTIDAILTDLGDQTFQRMIAVGGGSVIDIAKVMSVKDCYPIRRVMTHEVPPVLDKELIIVPTTCGTGSEVTYGGIITMSDTGFKSAIMDPTIVSSAAVLIPELVEGLPYSIFVNCSVDALGHAMEAYVSATRSNEMVRAVAAGSISLLLDGYVKLAREGEAAKAGLAKQFITASCLGGMSVNNGGAGPAHALAYPLGEKYAMGHGESIYQFLCPVFRYYEEQGGGEVLDRLKALIAPYVEKAGISCENGVFTGLEELLHQVHPLNSLRVCGMTDDDVQPFVENVFAAKQRLLAASCIPMDEAAVAEIYRQRLI